MKAAQLHEFGRGSAGLKVVEVPRPAPRAGEIVVRVHAVGANHLDLGAMSGQGPGSAVRLPLRVGIDPAGEVVAVGPEADPSRVGTRVVVKPNVPCGECRWCMAGAEAECPRQTVVGIHRPGGAAELVVVPERNAFAIPDGLSYVTAAAAVHSVPVALHMVRRAGGVLAGEPVVVTGADGAVGAALTQIVAALGAVPMPVVRSRERAAAASGTSPFPYLTYDELPGAAAEFADGGVRAAFDATGAAPAIAAAWSVLGWDGRLGVCSAALGAELAVDLRSLYVRRQRLVGSASADFRDVEDGLAMVAAGRVRVPLGPSFGLDNVIDAYRAVSDPSRRGKVIINVRDRR